jgi:hypothetical protein
VGSTETFDESCSIGVAPEFPQAESSEIWIFWKSPAPFGISVVPATGGDPGVKAQKNTIKNINFTRRACELVQTFTFLHPQLLQKRRGTQHLQTLFSGFAFGKQKECT